MVWNSIIYNLLFFPHIASSRNSTKAVQTKDRISSLDFPTPPPAVTNANEFSEQAPDEYLSLKVQRSDSASLYPNVHISSSSIVTYSTFSQSNHVNRRLTEQTDRQRQKTGNESVNSRRWETKKDTRRSWSRRKSRRKRRNNNSTRS